MRLFVQRFAAVAVACVFTAAARGDDAWLISKKDRVSVDAIPRGEPTPREGVVIWSDDGRERWRFAPAGWTIPASGEGQAGIAVADAKPSRGVALSGLGTLEMGQLTKQIDQLRIAGGTRDLDSSFLTPSRGGVLLSGAITIRRMPRTKENPYPADVAELAMLQSKKSWKLPFAEGVRAIAWKDNAAAKEFPQGLPEGNYTLQMAGKKTAFSIEPASVVRRMMQPLRAAERLLGSADPLYLAFAADHLMGKQDEAGVPMYAVDALDFLESQAKLPAALAKQRDTLVRWLEIPPEQRGEAVRAASATDDEPTGIAAIDQARGLIEKGDFRAAAKLLETRKSDAKVTRREKGLATLYLAVIRAEGGLATATSAESLFAEALASADDATPADRFRILTNWANYLHQQSQDLLYNQAFRMAAGSEQPVTAAVVRWKQANDLYEQASATAATLKSPTSYAAAQVNVLRHRALLGDLIRALDIQGDAKDLIAAAESNAVLAVSASLDLTAKLPALRGMVHEIDAQLAYRRGDLDLTRTTAAQAQEAYLQAGMLVGLENLQRLQALAAKTPEDAIRHYRVSTLLSESLRDRLPADRIGATQAGFFARKAWVFDKLTELLAQQGKADEALAQLELARARSLQDSLPKRAPRDDAQEGDLLANWPVETVALEYFLAGERAYVFFVNAKGRAKVVPLTYADGQPIPSAVLVAQVQRFLRGVEGQSAKMYQRILRGKGFDHAWQDELHTLYQELVPASVREEVKAAKTTVIVPQHILHYFPFAALVTERDTKERGKKEMVTPKFWVEEPGRRVVTPSLSFWLRVRQNPAEPMQQVQAVGLAKVPGAPELPGVEEDLKNLSAAFGKRIKKTIEGDAASVAKVRETLKQPGMLFFATHGVNDADHPLRSHLMLMPQADAKGIAEQAGHLTAQDLYETEIEADLIVMSACYSGLGDRSPLPGDDLFGLQRAFLQSGGRAVVAGLWDVYDGTAPDLMKAFFERLQSGEPAGDALQNAQRDFLAKLRSSGKAEPYLHPYFWAVYGLIGDDRVTFAK
jgi:CHAT domain-containing protein